MRKILCAVLISVLFFALVFSLASSASAENIAETDESGSAFVARSRLYPAPEHTAYAKLRYSGPDHYAADLAKICNVQSLRTSILNQMLQRKTSFDISSFQIPESNFYLVSDFIFRAMPESLLNPETSISCTTSNGKIKTLTGFTYLSAVTSAATARSQYNAFVAAANRLLDGIRGNDALTDAGKALLLHDRLAVWCE